MRVKQLFLLVVAVLQLLCEYHDDFVRPYLSYDHGRVVVIVVIVALRFRPH